MGRCSRWRGTPRLSAGERQLRAPVGVRIFNNSSGTERSPEQRGEVGWGMSQPVAVNFGRHQQVGGGKSAGLCPQTEPSQLQAWGHAGLHIPASRFRSGVPDVCSNQDNLPLVFLPRGGYSWGRHSFPRRPGGSTRQRLCLYPPTGAPRAETEPLPSGHPSSSLRPVITGPQKP